MSTTRKRLTDLIEDPETALGSTDPAIRRLAVAATLDRADLVPRITKLLATDPDATVRRECAEVLGTAAGESSSALQKALDDGDAAVREAAAFALGEMSAKASVPPLLDRALDQDEESLVREAAVAALGAIGESAAVPALLDLIATGPPQVRRRCVPALTVFDDDRIEPALRKAATDRNPMVREAAEMVVGRTLG